MTKPKDNLEERCGDIFAEISEYCEAWADDVPPKKRLLAFIKAELKAQRDKAYREGYLQAEKDSHHQCEEIKIVKAEEKILADIRAKVDGIPEIFAGHDGHPGNSSVSGDYVFGREQMREEVIKILDKQ